jgi:hypothetical protein
MQSRGESHVRLDRVEFIDNDSGAVHLWALGPSGRLGVWVGPGCEVIDNFWRVFRVGADDGGQVQIDLAGTREEPITLRDNFRGIELTLTEGSSLEARNVIAADSRYEGLRLVMTGRPARARFDNCLFAVNGVAPFYRYDLDHPTNVHLENTSGGPASVEFTRCTIHAVGARGGGDGDPHQWPTVVRGTGSSLEALFTNCILSGSGAEEAFDLRDDDGEMGTSNTAWLRQCATIFQGPQAMGHINAIGAGTMIFEGLRIEDPAFPNVDRPPDDLSFDVTNQDFAVWGPGGAPLTGWGDFRDSSLVGIRLR